MSDRTPAQIEAARKWVAARAENQRRRKGFTVGFTEALAELRQVERIMARDEAILSELAKR